MTMALMTSCVYRNLHDKALLTSCVCRSLHDEALMTSYVCRSLHDEAFLYIKQAMTQEMPNINRQDVALIM